MLDFAVPLLLEWYRISKRELPWRTERTPYRILVSEIMLQQTRVEAVKGYYLRFLTSFPTAEALANASEEEVLKAWEGLGYYTRARNLHKAAKVIAKCGFPTTYEQIRALPGVGDYTAGAIASIAFGLPCPAVDGNVLRILTRLFADGGNIDEPATKERFRTLLKEAEPADAGEFTEALMELGAIVCLPNGEPLCISCPWRELCKAHLEGRESAFPVRKQKKERKIVPLTVLVLTREGKYALEKRQEKGLLAGLYQFPFCSTEPALFGVPEKTKTAKHIFTHVEWHMTGYLVQAKQFFKEYLWVTREELFREYALPSAFKAFLEWID